MWLIITTFHLWLRGFCLLDNQNPMWKSRRWTVDVVMSWWNILVLRFYLFWLVYIQTETQPHFKEIKLVRSRFPPAPRVLFNSCSERTKSPTWPAVWPTQLQPLQSWTFPDHSEDVAFCGINVQRRDIPPAFNSPWTSPMRRALNHWPNHSEGMGEVISQTRCLTCGWGEQGCLIW